MVEIFFNVRNNGACPICKNLKNCPILINLKEATNKVCKPKYDNKLEIVIYRCPEFTEKI